MNTRTVAEVNQEIVKAYAERDFLALEQFASELDSMLSEAASGWAEHTRGRALFSKGHYTDALSQLAIALQHFRNADEKRGVADTHMQVSSVHFFTADYGVALSEAKEALDLFMEINDDFGVAESQGLIGQISLWIGDNAGALENLEKFRVFFEESGDKKHVGQGLTTIGNVYLHMGDYPNALRYYHQSQSIFEEVQDRHGIAACHGCLAIIYAQIGDYSRALELDFKALEIFEELNQRSQILWVTRGIGYVHKVSGDYDGAMAFFERSLELAKELEMKGEIANSLTNLTDVLISTGRFDEARTLFEPLSSMEIHEPMHIVEKEMCRARLQDSDGDVESALTTLDIALERAEHFELRDMQADIHMLQRDLYKKLKDFEKYVQYNDLYHTISNEVRGTEAARKMALQETERELESKRREIETVRREHEKQLAILHSTLPKHIADRVARGELVHDQHDNAAVLFLDIVGFTRISSQIPPRHVVHLLESIFKHCDDVIERNGLTKIKTIGDSYMAVAFGEIANSEQQIANSKQQVASPSESAASAAIELIEALDALQLTMPPELGDRSWVEKIPKIDVRIGLHCGPVVAGVIGTQRMQYDVWGDTVNIASRMESTSEPGRIHVSEQFARALYSAPLSEGEGQGESSLDIEESPLKTPGTWNVKPRGEVDIKGIGRMTTFWLNP